MPRGVISSLGNDLAYTLCYRQRESVTSVRFDVMQQVFCCHDESSFVVVR
jgi:hypothetical protein